MIEPSSQKLRYQNVRSMDIVVPIPRLLPQAELFLVHPNGINKADGPENCNVADDMISHHCKRKIEHDLAKVVGIPRPTPEPIRNQQRPMLNISQQYIFLAVRQHDQGYSHNVHQKSAENVGVGHPRRHRLLSSLDLPRARVPRESDLALS